MKELTNRLTKPGFSTYSIAAVISAILLWAYWPTLVEMVAQWSHDPQYSHGYLVPGFSILFLWLHRKKIFQTNRNGSYWGIAILLAALILRLAGTSFYYTWLDPISILPTIVGIVVLFCGWSIFHYSWSAIAYLFFMIPLPYNLSISLAGPLQRVATEMSTFFLQVLGQPAVAEGNVILLNEFELGVVEACSGLRMLVVFFATATAVAMLLKKQLWEKSLLVISAVPIAIFSNILRITITGVLYETAGKEIAEEIFHDLSGWLMMPLALSLLGIEIFLLQKILNNKTTMTTNANIPDLPQVFSARLKRSRISRNQDNQFNEPEPVIQEKTVG